MVSLNDTIKEKHKNFVNNIILALGKTHKGRIEERGAI